MSDKIDAKTGLPPVPKVDRRAGPKERDASIGAKPGKKIPPHRRLRG